MARKYTEEQLNKLDKDILITLFLGLQDQMDQMGRNLELLTEQIAIMNFWTQYGKEHHHRDGRTGTPRRDRRRAHRCVQ